VLSFRKGGPVYTRACKSKACTLDSGPALIGRRLTSQRHSTDCAKVSEFLKILNHYQDLSVWKETDCTPCRKSKFRKISSYTVSLKYLTHLVVRVEFCEVAEEEEEKKKEYYTDNLSPSVCCVILQC